LHDRNIVHRYIDFLVLSIFFLLLAHFFSVMVAI
jgi:hypothetical protein